MELDSELIKTLVEKLYDNVVPAIDTITPVDGFSDRIYTFEDNLNDKKYILSIIDQGDINSDLTDLLCDVFECGFNAYDKEYEFVVPRLVRTRENLLNGWIRFRHQRNGLYSRYLSIERCNFKLFQFNFGISTSLLDLFSQQEDYHGKQAVDERYLLMGWVAGKIFLFNNNKIEFKDRLKHIRGKSCYEAASVDGLKKLYARLCPFRKLHIRSLIHQSFIDFDEIKSKLEQYPEFMLSIDPFGQNIVIDLDGVCGSNLFIFDLKELRVGRFVVDIAAVVTYNIISQNLFTCEEALEHMVPPIIAGYECAKIVIPNKELIMVPQLMKMRLCYILIIDEIKKHPDVAAINETLDRAIHLLELLVRDPVFKDPKQLIKLWRSPSNNNLSAVTAKKNVQKVNFRHNKKDKRRHRISK